MNRNRRDNFIAHVGHSYSDVHIWGQYERLVDFIFKEFEKSNRRFDEISLPTLSLLSHAIELALKENIKFYKTYHESEHLTKFDSWVELIKSHDLKSLAEEFKIAYFKLHKKVNADEGEKAQFQKYFVDLLELIGILDRNTETYRYSLKIDNDGKAIKRSIDQSKQVDFLRVKGLFDKAKTLFLGAPNSLGHYTDYIDFKKGNPTYLKGTGYLYCQRLPYSEHFLETVKSWLDEQLNPLPNGTWMNSKTGENFEIQIWKNDIYIIAI